MEQKLTLRFSPEKQDYVRASRTLALKSSWFIYAVVLILLILAGSGFILANPEMVAPMLRSMALILFLLSLAYVFYFVFVIPIQLGKAYKNNKHLQQERILVFWDDHLQMQIGNSSVSLPWDDLKKVVAGKRYYLLIFEGEEKVFPFIPRKDLDESHRLVFLEFFQKKSIQVI